MKLTDLAISRLSSPETGQKTYFDEGLKNFGVRISQGGTKSFVVLLGKQRHRRTIGRYPDWSLANARRAAKKLLATADIEELAKRPSVPFSDAKERFLADAAARNRAKTNYEYQRLLNRHFAFQKPIHQLTRQDIMWVIESLKNVPSEQKHAFVAIRTMMNWCVKQGLLNTSPVPRLSLKVESRDRVLSDAELAEVWGRAGDFGYPYGTIVQLLVLTGQRRGETAALQWDWVESDRIVFPSGITKNRRTHYLPIGPKAQEIIASVPKDSDLLFPSRFYERRPFNGWSKCKKRFDEGLSFQDYTLHDLRRTFATNLAQLGTPNSCNRAHPQSYFGDFVRSGSCIQPLQL